ncbi:hypothetical protein, partial [Janthinobacterium sp. HH106]|uniref:hypothetical protein n=1 Tax=Janthinobacterium sp. HH106 TaxID=1537278 RepID=UPI001C2F5DD8
CLERTTDEQQRSGWRKESVMATKLDEWKVLPRLMMLVTTIMYIRCLEWALSQPDLSVSQAGLISVVTGAFTGSFGIWMGKESK